ncbi:MAG: NAD(P)/FAD-dependent oxidoreductase [Novosphingobium sp.]
MQPSVRNSEKYDVVVCGGGWAGLCAALQLRQQDPDLSVLVIERHAEPLPDARFKVGESTVELATTYLKRLGLADHLENEQLPKFGLRFYVGEGTQPIAERMEVGLRVFPPFRTHQVDRGRFETRLRALLRADGVEIREGARVSTIAITPGDEPNSVVVVDAHGDEQHLSARWVIDASGRRRLIQRSRKLSLQEITGKSHAAWFRIKGRVAVADLVCPSEQSWHRRTIEDRWNATNHIVGDGYWIWLIPLVSGHTSIGLVFDPDRNPDVEISRGFAGLADWLKVHQPALYEHLDGRELLDFQAIRDYGYHSSQTFSCDGWACVGEAGVFLDPLYSPGGDFIAVSNTLACNLIAAERNGKYELAELAELYNSFYLNTFSKLLAPVYPAAFATFANPLVFLVKHIWDSAFYWSIICPIFMQNTMDCPVMLSAMKERLDRLAELQARVQALFTDWAARSARPRPSAFFDVSLIPYFQLIVLELNLPRRGQEILDALDRNIARLEEAAQVIFFSAIEELYPEEFARFDRHWVNAWGIGLDPARWEKDGLFQSTTPARDLAPIAHALFGDVLVRVTAAGRQRRKLFRAFQAAFSGRLFYTVWPGLRAMVRKRIVKPRAWWFVPRGGKASRLALGLSPSRVR